MSDFDASYDSGWFDFAPHSVMNRTIINGISNFKCHCFMFYLMPTTANQIGIIILLET